MPVPENLKWTTDNYDQLRANRDRLAQNVNYVQQWSYDVLDNKVFFQWQEMHGIQWNSFRVFDGGYASDWKIVIFEWRIVSGLNAGSLSVMQNWYARAGDQMIFKWEVLKWINSAQFRYLWGGYYSDWRVSVYNGKSLEWVYAWDLRFLWDGYASDGGVVLYEWNIIPQLSWQNMLPYKNQWNGYVSFGAFVVYKGKFLNQDSDPDQISRRGKWNYYVINNEFRYEWQKIPNISGKLIPISDYSFSGSTGYFTDWKKLVYKWQVVKWLKDNLNLGDISSMSEYNLSMRTGIEMLWNIFEKSISVKGPFLMVGNQLIYEGVVLDWLSASKLEHISGWYYLHWDSVLYEGQIVRWVNASKFRAIDDQDKNNPYFSDGTVIVYQGKKIEWATYSQSTVLNKKSRPYYLISWNQVISNGQLIATVANPTKRDAVLWDYFVYWESLFHRGRFLTNWVAPESMKMPDSAWYTIAWWKLIYSGEVISDIWKEPFTAMQFGYYRLGTKVLYQGKILAWVDANKFKPLALGELSALIMSDGKYLVCNGERFNALPKSSWSYEYLGAGYFQRGWQVFHFSVDNKLSLLPWVSSKSFKWLGDGLFTDWLLAYSDWKVIPWINIAKLKNLDRNLWTDGTSVVADWKLVHGVYDVDSYSRMYSSARLSGHGIPLLKDQWWNYYLASAPSIKSPKPIQQRIVVNSSLDAWILPSAQSVTEQSPEQQKEELKGRLRQLIGGINSQLPVNKSVLIKGITDLEAMASSLSLDWRKITVANITYDWMLKLVWSDDLSQAIGEWRVVLEDKKWVMVVKITLQVLKDLVE